MLNEDLLATYSLLSYIRENLGSDKRDTLVYVFVPLVKEALAGVLAEHGHSLVMGKDYTEIKDQIANVFKIDMPISVLETILPIVSDEAGDLFQLYKDHSFIIKPYAIDSIMGEHKAQKDRIEKLKRNFTFYCKGHGVDADFEGLMAFVQHQKNNIFDNGDGVDIDSQNYHISKYVNTLIKKKNAHFLTLCDLYLGGVISAYLKFQVKGRIVDTELLIDTNFYISLLNLNTAESYETCKQLFEMTVAMGFRYKILETTISQIRILLSNKIADFGNKDVFSAIDQADVLAACERRGMNLSQLQSYKDELITDLKNKGITTIYTSNISKLVDKAKKSKDYKLLTSVRGNQESALNDVLAQEYVDYKRNGQPIFEFIDVNCWFLTNSFSTNKSELDKPIWGRRHINASDLLVLLWYANPSLSIGVEKTMLAVTSLSANVLKYRTEKHSTEKIIKELTSKISSLQQDGYITENALAKLCIRMSEGCIDNTEAERLLVLSTKDFVEYVNKIQVQEEAYAEELEVNEDLRNELSDVKTSNFEARLIDKLKIQRLHTILYIIAVILVWWFGSYGIKMIGGGLLQYLFQLLYWLVCTIVVNWFSHSYFFDGLRSFFQKEKMLAKLRQREMDNQGGTDGKKISE